MIDPIKLCCGRPASEHSGPMCPDRLTMCCICFERFPKEELVVDDHGVIWDVCRECGENEGY